MRVQMSIPGKDSELLEVSTTDYEAVKDSKLFDNPAAKALVEAFGVARDSYKVGCDEARFHDMLKVAARKELRKTLVATHKRVLHYIEAMASDDELKELQKSGLRVNKPRARKKKSKGDQAEVDLAPAGA